MTKLAVLKTVDSYHEIFSTLARDLKSKPSAIENKNLVFCEEKVSLMVERNICSALGGTFNTEVFSFGKFLRAKNPKDKMLSKEGSSMALKRIIHGLDLKCFSQSKNTLSSSIYDLLILLKSASLSFKDVEEASLNTDGVLKNKLTDIAVIFKAYEDFISENGFIDQSTALSLLPDIIRKDQKVKDADVYLVGYVGWTKQAREIVSALLETAKSVTAILPFGDNKELFVGETADMFRRLCKNSGALLVEEKVQTPRCEEASIIQKTVFNPLLYRDLKYESDKVFITTAPTVYDEVNRIAQTIKATAMQKGAKYSDFMVVVPSVTDYADTIRTCFSTLEIPSFIDEEKSVSAHPLIRLISSYHDARRKNLERRALLSFAKNPLFYEDKKFLDAFENYLIKRNVNFDKIKTPFTHEGIDLEKANALRERLVKALSFDAPKKMLEFLGVEDRIETLSIKLKNLSRNEEASVNEQIYGAVIGILDQMDLLLSGTPLTEKERKDLFISGTVALKLSVIPQYNDAVFVGSYKEACLASPKFVFMLGLTSAVPSAKEDVAILTDGEIERLENVKVLIEPKISIINKREIECVGMTMSAFKEKLFLSYPLTTEVGKSTSKSELIDYAEKVFSAKRYAFNDDVLTVNQTLLKFAKECGEYAECKTNDNALSTTFYQMVKENPSILKDQNLCQNILDAANKEIKLTLTGGACAIRDNVVSPTAIEGFYQCPYRAFLSRTLKINEREKGEVSAQSVGNIAHRIFELFIKFIEKNPDADEETAFNYALENLLADEEFNRFTEDEVEKETFNRAMSESRIYCHKLFEFGKNSAFRTVGYEAGFGDGKKYPAISLNGGKFKVAGKIDRVDEYEDYFRVIDYKTGGFNVDEEGLFTGTALQLYLYSAAVMGNGKKPAGMYYFPVNEEYASEKEKNSKKFAHGRTLEDEFVLSAQDCNYKEKNHSLSVTVNKDGTIKGASTQKTIVSHIDYALKMCENATTQMSNGVIAQTPFGNACGYCQYKGMCEFQDTYIRKVNKVDEEVIDTAINKGDQSGT